MKSIAIKSLSVIILLSILMGFAGNSVAFANDTVVTIDNPEEAEGGLTTLDFSGCGITSTNAIDYVMEQRTIELVNIERAKIGVQPVKRNAELDMAVRNHTRDMVEDNYFAHDSQDRDSSGNLFTICGTFDRVGQYYTGYSWAGEILAAGFTTPEQAIVGWMNSPSHRDLLLKAVYREVGVGFYTGNAYYTNYWGQNFGTRSNVYPVVMNLEAYSTDNAVVNVYLYGKGEFAEMRLVNDDGSTSGWLPFADTFDWTLPWVKGERTLTVELRKAGSSTVDYVTKDTIVLTAGKAVVENLPSTINLTYSRNDGRVYSDANNIRLDGAAELTWTVTNATPWLTVTPYEGSVVSDRMVLGVEQNSVPANGTYNGDFSVTVQSNDTSVEKTVYDVQVNMVVVDSMTQVFLPITFR